MATFDVEAIGPIFRAESGRAVATLIRVFGDVSIAEDAVQDAFTTAVERWPEEGATQPGGLDRRHRTQLRDRPTATGGLPR